MKYLLVLMMICAFVCKVQAQTTPAAPQSLSPANPWTDAQLIAPADLVSAIEKGGATAPTIFNIGAVDDIKGAKHIGAMNMAGSPPLLEKAIAALPKNTAIVIYCGCCPFARCPNIRPAFLALKQAGFTNVKLLNLPVNLKTNWIGKGYPLEGK
jgi:rhodanese-related sulfurtransferase